ncbi:MAG: hypothetical protein AB4080_18450 [Trichodesmium sp.]
MKNSYLDFFFLITKKLCSKASLFKEIKKEAIPDMKPLAFLGHTAQTARGTDKEVPPQEAFSCGMLSLRNAA